jgi:hypothetical protein
VTRRYNFIKRDENRMIILKWILKEWVVERIYLAGNKTNGGIL